MRKLLTLDSGHLLNSCKVSFDAKRSRYSEAFLELQSDLRERSLPIAPPVFDDRLADRIESDLAPLRHYDNLLILGIGGSTLGFRALLNAVHGPYYNLFKKSGPQIFVVDNVDPAITHTLLQELDLEKTLIVYITKSGSTPEPAANFLVFFDAYRAAGGDLHDLILICDRAENGVNRIARDLNAHTFYIPNDLSGRFSVLSSVGLVPAYFAGIDIRALLQGAREMHREALSGSLEHNPCFLLGSLLHAGLGRDRNIHFVFSYSNLLTEFNLWLIQLWSESLGKKYDLEGKQVNTGTTPVSGLGATDQHSILQLLKEGPQDKVIGFLKVSDRGDPVRIPSLFPDLVEYSYFGGHSLAEQMEIEQISTEIALLRSGVPCYSLAVDKLDAASMGCLFYFWELITIFFARLDNVNPFDQPGVEEGKKMTYALMGREDHANIRDNQEQLLERHRDGSFHSFVACRDSD